MTTIEKLTEIFKKFPGIGPRQAHRFVYYLLTRSAQHNDELARLVSLLRGTVVECAACHRFFENTTRTQTARQMLCDIDRDVHRDATILMVVSRDVDLESVEKSGAYKGLYFVLGGSIPILAEKPEERIRQKELLEIVRARVQEGLREIILAMNVTPEGDHTGDYLTRILAPIVSDKIKISRLGRGVSTGTELEYSDSDTLKFALQNRG